MTMFSKIIFGFEYFMPKYSQIKEETEKCIKLIERDVNKIKYFHFYFAQSATNPTTCVTNNNFSKNFKPFIKCSNTQKCSMIIKFLNSVLPFSKLTFRIEKFKPAGKYIPK